MFNGRMDRAIGGVYKEAIGKVLVEHGFTGKFILRVEFADPGEDPIITFDDAKEQFRYELAGGDNKFQFLYVQAYLDLFRERMPGMDIKLVRTQ